LDRSPVARQIDRAPGKESVRHIERQIGILVLPDDGRSKVAEVAVEVVEVAAGAVMVVLEGACLDSTPQALTTRTARMATVSLIPC